MFDIILDICTFSNVYFHILNYLISLSTGHLPSLNVFNCFLMFCFFFLYTESFCVWFVRFEVKFGE